MLGLEGDVERINLSLHESPEFEDWTWVDYWRPVQEVVSFKQAVYHQALTELEETLEKFWLPR
jgi:putative (di)nucleoside polyphosphate hydrolase